MRLLQHKAFVAVAVAASAVAAAAAVKSNGPDAIQSQRLNASVGRGVLAEEQQQQTAQLQQQMAAAADFL